MKTAEMEVTNLYSATAEATVPDMGFDYEGSGCTCDWKHGNCDCLDKDPFEEETCGCC